MQSVCCPSPTTVVVPPPSWAINFDWNAEFPFSLRESLAVRSDAGLVANGKICSRIGLMMRNILIQQLTNHLLVGSTVFLGFRLEESNALCA